MSTLVSRKSWMTVLCLAALAGLVTGLLAHPTDGRAQPLVELGDPVSFEDPCPGSPGYVPPWLPKPIAPEPGQILLYPMTVCGGSGYYSIRVLGGTAQLVTRSRDLESECWQYFAWGEQPETLNRCPGQSNEPGQPGYKPDLTRPLWLWGNPGDYILLEIDCDCDDQTEGTQLITIPGGNPSGS